MRLSRAALVIFALQSTPMALAESCDDGTLTSNAVSAAIDVTYATTDASGAPVVGMFSFMSTTRFDASLSESHSYEPTTGIYTYTYVLASSASSEQPIWLVGFSIPRTVTLIEHSHDSSDLSWTFLPEDQNIGGIAWMHLPNLERWTQAPDVVGLHPGVSITFTLKSLFGPGPMNVFLKGEAPTATFPDDLSPCMSRLIHEQRTFPLAYVKKVSIGPTVSP